MTYQIDLTNPPYDRNFSGEQLLQAIAERLERIAELMEKRSEEESLERERQETLALYKPS